MDCIESASPFEQVGELFPLPSLSILDDIPIPQLPLIVPPNHNLSCHSHSHNPKNVARRKTPTSSDDVQGDNPNDHKKKKIIHRDVERQRRQEMSTLYATLRSLLPLEYLKGKRSICDHIHETVKYLRHMQTNIQELSRKRDELKRLSDGASHATVETLQASIRDSVVVSPRCGGIQVVLDTATQHRMPVSNILEALIADGLAIVGCMSTRINDRFLHTIECQALDVGGGRSIDLSELQHKLTNLEYFPVD